MLARPRIRQLTLGELFDEAFRIYRRDLLTLIAIVAVLTVPFTILQFALTLPTQGDLNQGLQLFQQLIQDPGAVPPEAFDDPAFAAPPTATEILLQLALVGLSFLNLLVLQPILWGALAYAVTQRYLDQQPTVAGSLRAALRRSLSLIGAVFLPGLGLIVGFSVLFGCLIFGGTFATVGLFSQFGTTNSEPNVALVLLTILLGVLAFLALGLAALAFVVRLLFIPQAVVAEQRGPFDAIGRSWSLVKGYFWRTLGIALLIWLLQQLIVYVPSQILTTLLLGFTLFRGDGITEAFVLGSVISTLATLIITPFSLIAFTLMYFDLRIRKEGFDLEQQARALASDATIGPTQPFNP
jgi:lysylphosphatidylglycerol synthetase-like protein (DUF2156 family)